VSQNNSIAVMNAACQIGAFANVNVVFKDDKKPCQMIVQNVQQKKVLETSLVVFFDLSLAKSSDCISIAPRIASSHTIKLAAILFWTFAMGAVFVLN